MENAPLFVSIEEAARISSLSRSTIYNLMRDGRLGSRKQGRRRLISYASLAQVGQEERAVA